MSAFPGSMATGRELTASDVAARLRHRHERHHAAFQRVVGAVLAKIEAATSSGRGGTHVVHRVPEFQVGFPVYDLGECVAFVTDRLRKSGFDVALVVSSVLVVSWCAAAKRAAAPARAPRKAPMRISFA